MCASGAREWEGSTARGVEERHGRPQLGAGAAAGQQILPGRVGRQIVHVDRVEEQLDRRQVFVVGHGLLGLGEELRRVRRHHVGDPNRDRRGLPDEVDVLEPADHHGGAPARVGGGERGGVADVVFGGGIGITASDQVGTRSR